MLLEIFKAAIYLPSIAICMIVSQTYFNRYRATLKSPFTKFLLVIVILAIYFIQEFCLIQLSIHNIGIVAFVQVLPLAMVFRENAYKIWWLLLGLTPLFTNTVELYYGRLTLSHWYLGIIYGLILLLISALLTRQRNLSWESRYFLALTALGILKLTDLWIAHQLNPVTITAATIGLLIIALLEDRIYKNEITTDNHLKLLENESERDDLTGLLNYRALCQEINNLTNNKNIYKIVIAALDIDHFKHVNDTYGHFIGNAALNYFSTIFREKLHKTFPQHGYVYRFGGEEFSIVVTNHSQEKVYHFLQSIEVYFSHHPFITEDGVKITISFSSGLTSHYQDETLDTTLRRADKMLYKVKNNGRGWVIMDQQHLTNEKPTVTQVKEMDR